MELNLPFLIDSLKEEELKIIQECLIIIKGGVPSSKESLLPFKNKLFQLQESLSHFRNKLLYLINLKKIEAQKYEGNNFDFYGDGKRKSKEDKKTEMVSSDSQYSDMLETTFKYESILKYLDDLYFIIINMSKIDF
jgi:hypothetical protein